MISTTLEIPSYTQGFARCAAEAQRPELWEGLQGLWLPFLGPTGLTLFNWSPQGQSYNGGLANMTPATAWVATELGHAICFSASNHRITIPEQSSMAQGLSFLTWGKKRSDPAISPLCGGYAATGMLRPKWYLLAADPKLYIRLTDGGTTHSADVGYSAASMDGQFQFFAVTAVPNGPVWCYLNRSAVQATASAGTIDFRLAYWGFDSYVSDRSWPGDFAIWAVYDRVLAPSEIWRFYDDCYLLSRSGRRRLGILPAVGGPYDLAAGGVFHTGAATGELFSTGSVIGECHG